jgi:predicted nucleotidyltransferase
MNRQPFSGVGVRWGYSHREIPFDKPSSLHRIAPMSVIPHSVRDEILARLARIEEEERVRILLAVESGSRAWGFASADSDFDVRFVYARQSDWYFSIDVEKKRDVLEFGVVDEIDLNGWDVRKALQLFQKSNPVFVEWLQSPLVYLEQEGFANATRQLIPDVLSRSAATHHYRSMVKTNRPSPSPEGLVRTKKYFYALRAVLAVRWLKRFDTAPPMEFERLLVLLDDQPELLTAILELLEKKRSSPELGLGPAVPLFDQFLDAEMARTETVDAADSRQSDATPLLNALFRRTVTEAWPT